MTALRRRLLLVALALLPLCSTVASAQTRAWLDRDRIGPGETVTLNIETTERGDPDYAPLQRDFVASGHTSRKSFDIANGRVTTRSLYAVALRPRRDGALTVPALRVGPATTRPLALTVDAGLGAVPARSGDDVFIESEADDDDPYVQQSVGWVVRLYSRAPLVSGQLDQPAPDGASLQRIGDDAQYSRDLGGRRYYVIERRFQLVPERSGMLTMPGATFAGRGAGGFFDELFGDRGGALSATARPRFLQVRGIPANAPQPWLPLRGLTLRYLATPSSLQAGAAATLTIEAVADGAHAAQLPPLQLPPIDGVQVFAEPAQSDDSARGGRPRTRVVRSFALVPTRAGEVRLGGVRLPWWDVGRGAARTAELPPLTWNAAAAPSSAAGDAPVARAGGADARPLSARVASTTGGAARGWILAALLFAALWLFTLVWALQQRTRTAIADARGPQQAASPAPAPLSRVTVADLRRLLDRGDLSDVAATLPRLASPPLPDLDAVIAALDDAGQREAVAALQRAQWGDGDGVDARTRLRRAFASGIRWRQPPPSAATSVLPPLYPPG